MATRFTPTVVSTRRSAGSSFPGGRTFRYLLAPLVAGLCGSLAACGSVATIESDAEPGGGEDGGGTNGVDASEDDDNQPPGVTGVVLDGQSPAFPITLTCEASDPDGDALTYTFTASAGTVTPEGGETAIWVPPVAEGLYEVGCGADDGRGGADELVIDVELRVADGLIAHYEFRGDGTDSSGNGLDGSFLSLGGSTEFADDRFGNPEGAAILTGNNSLRVDHAPAFDNLTEFTLATWVAVDAANSDRTIVSKPSDVGFGNFTLLVFADDAQFNAGQASYAHDTAAGNVGVGAGGPLPVGSFVHVAVTVDSDQIRSYFEGDARAATSEPPAPVTNTDALIIGGGRGSFRGLIDDVRIYDRALSAAEIEALASGTL